MPHVVTQSCVGDGSCVFACPVNCIQPTPDDPAFELAELLHIDPATCVDCGACVTACPVDAIKPHTQLVPGEAPFEVVNAAYHRTPRPRPALAPVRPPLQVRRDAGPLRVAIVGSGPAAMYAAEELLTIPGARVTVLERLPTPFGLVRSGVAPDHRRTRRIARQLERIAAHPGLTLRLGVEVGRDVTHLELLADHDAVIYAVGAATDRPLAVPGAELPGVHAATEVVGWYTGHPDHAALQPDLSARRAVVIGTGNVALDLARILTVDPDALGGSEIAPAALQALRRSAIAEVVVLGRRGPEHSAFTLPELIGLTATPGVSVAVEPDGVLDGAPAGDPKLELLRALGPHAPDARRRITLRYDSTPVAVHGDDAVRAVEIARTGTPERTARIDAGLVVSAIGLRGRPVPGLPFDEATGVVPNVDGRVVPGTYVVGWIKRGPSGFIGTNKACAQDTVAALVDDHNAGRLAARHAGATA
jgi:ferredoxin--NADP+ reductase